MTIAWQNDLERSGSAAAAPSPPSEGGRELANRVEAMGRWRREGQARLFRELPVAAVDVVLCLPYLLHRNDPKLPGFQRDGVPGGVVELVLQPAHRAALTRYFGYRGPVPFTPASHPAFAALIAETRGVTPDKQFPRVELHAFVSEDAVPGAPPASLRDKLAQIEAWALQREVALSIQLHRAAGRAVVVRDVTAAERDVLDRVYARGVLVGGQLPVWWLVPDGLAGAAYEAAVRRIRGLGGRATWEFVDLGAPEPDDPAAVAELFLWRVTNEEQPFAERAVILLALEAALRRVAAPVALSTLVKRFLYARAPYAALGCEAAVRLDHLRDAVRERHGARALLALERVCLVELARAPGSAERAEADQALAWWGERWGWSVADRSPAALKERARAVDGDADGQVLRELLKTVAVSFADAAVAEPGAWPALVPLLGRLRDWLILSSPRPVEGSVPLLLGPLMGATRAEESLRIRPAAGDPRTWQVSRPTRSAAGAAAGWEVVHEAAGLVPVVVWACLNGVLGESTRLVDDGITAVTQLAGQLRAWFTGGSPVPVGPSLHREAHDLDGELYVALGHVRPVVDGAAAQLVPGNGNWDPLNWGQGRVNQLDALVHVERLAGGSCRTTSYGGTDGVLALVSRLASPVGPQTVPTLIAVAQDSVQRAIGARLRDLLATVANAHGHDRRVLFELGGRVFGVDGRGHTTSYDDEELRRMLAQPGAAGRLVLDRSSRRLDVVAAALSVARDDPWHICYARDQQAADVFVCDETGALHWEKTSVHRLDGQIVNLLDVLRESHPGRRRGPESVEIERMQDGRLRRTPSSHSTLRSLRRRTSLHLEGDVARGPVVVRLGDDELARERDPDEAIRGAAAALLARQRPGKEELPPVASAKLTRDGAPLSPVELVERIEELRAALVREMRRALEEFRRRTP